MPFFQSPKPKEFRVKELNSSLSAEGMCWGSLQCFWGTVKESADSCHANCTLYHDGSVRLSSQLPLQYIYTITQTDKTHESEKTTWGMFLYQISVWHEINPADRSVFLMTMKYNHFFTSKYQSCVLTFISHFSLISSTQKYTLTFRCDLRYCLEQWFPNLSWRTPCPAHFVCLPNQTHPI